MHRPWYTYLFVKSPVLKILLGILFVLLSAVFLLGMLVVEPDRMQAQAASWQGRSIEKGADIFNSNCFTCHGAEGKGTPGPALHSKYFFTQRLIDVGFAGTLENYIMLTVSAGRPSKVNGQWGVIMPTWSNHYGGPMRDDQIQNVADYVMNWKADALKQTPDQDPWIPFKDAPSKAPGAAAGQAPATTPAAQASQAPRSPEQLFNTDMGCSGCHKLDQPQTDSNRGPVAPNLGNLADVAGKMMPGEDAMTYVRTSIMNPNAFIVPGYQPNIMPQNFANRMTKEEIDGLANWLLNPKARK